MNRAAFLKTASRLCIITAASIVGTACRDESDYRHRPARRAYREPEPEEEEEHRPETEPEPRDSREPAGEAPTLETNPQEVPPPPQNPVPQPVVGNPQFGIKVPNKPGFIKSPYTGDERLIDVRGLPPSSEIECPYTKRSMLVP
jgi:hypothetical protein